MQVVIEAMTGMILKVGGNFITLNPAGVQIQGTMVMINSGGVALSGSLGSLVSPLSSTDPQEADKAQAGQVGSTSASPTSPAKMKLENITPARRSPASDAPTHDPNSEENKEKKHWIEIELLDESGKPIAGEPYKVTLPDGSTIADGTLDDKGRARVDNIDPGTCKVTFPNLDQDARKTEVGRRQLSRRAIVVGIGQIRSDRVTILISFSFVELPQQTAALYPISVAVEMDIEESRVAQSDGCEGCPSRARQLHRTGTVRRH
jgi:hypothetical protein